MAARKKRTAAEEREIKERLRDEHLIETFPDEPEVDARTAAVLAARDKFVARLEAVDPTLVDAFQECLSAIIGPLQAMHAELDAETRRVRKSLRAGTKKTKGKAREK